MSEPGSLIRTLSGRAQARNFHSYVIGEVGMAIVSGRMPVGSILPGDAEMMDRFGVSRTVLREALKTLEAKGLVEARARVGTRVLPQARWSLHDRLVLEWFLESGPSPEFLSGFRRVRAALELEAAAEAALHREGEHLRLLNYWMRQRSLAAREPEPFALAEFEIHRVIAEASGNPFLRASTALAEFGVAHAVRQRLGPELEPPPEGLSALKQAEHAALLLAVEQRDPVGARSAMAAILEADG